MKIKIKSLYYSIIKNIKGKQLFELTEKVIKLTELLIEGVEDKKVSPKVAVKYFESLYTPRFYGQLDNLSKILVSGGLLLRNKNYKPYLALLKETLESVKEGVTKERRIKETKIIVLKVRKKLKKKLGRSPTSEEVMDYLRKYHPDRVSHKPFDIMDFVNFKIRKRVN